MKWKEVLKGKGSKYQQRMRQHQRQQKENEKPIAPFNLAGGPSDKKRAEQAFNRMVLSVNRRFEQGNPMRNIALKQMMDLDKKLFEGEITNEEWDDTVSELREQLKMLLNNIFDNPFGGEDIDKWLETNGFK